MLAANNLYICRGGSEDTQTLTQLLPTLINSDDTELRRYCVMNNFLNVSDITILTDEGREWYFEGPLERIKPLLPTIPPSGPSPLLVGQYWKLNHQLPTFELHTNDVIRIDGHYK